MGWATVIALAALCVQQTLTETPILIQDASLHGMWSMGRSIRRGFHYTCTLQIDSPIDYLSVAIFLPSSYMSETVWGLEHVERRDSEDNSTVVYQTTAVVYPPRYVLNFHIESMSRDFTPTCTWTILDRPLVPVTTTTTTKHPFIFTTESGRDTTDGSPHSFYPEDACQYVNDNFVAGKPSTTTDAPMNFTVTPPFVLPPRGPPFSGGFGRGRARRQVSEYPEVNYTRALELSMWFYDAQRSGPIPEYLGGSPISWTKTSGLNHVTTDGRDLTGGWYNGNDGVKINKVMAYSTFMLEWGFSVWGNVYIKAGLSERLKDSLMWPLEYLYKCWDQQEKILYVQVGDLTEDRNIWERFDSDTYTDMTVPIFNVTAPDTASDVAADMASAFAMAYMAIDGPDDDPKFLEAAMSLYDFARKNKGVADVATSSQDYPSYPSTDFLDDLCLAAILLFQAESDDVYLNQAERFFRQSADASKGKPFSWDNKLAACAILLHETTYKSDYQVYVYDFLNAWINGPQTQEGFPDTGEAVSLHYIANAAYIGLMAIEYEVIESRRYAEKIVNWSIRNINRILGWNPDKQSYLIGYSDRSPRNPHHKNSACPDASQSCGWEFYNSGSPNAHTLVGALVGGPDQYGSYADTRQNKMGNSVMIEYNAGFQSALAGLQNYRQKFEERCKREQPDKIDTTTTTTSTTPKETTLEPRTRYTTPIPSAPPAMPEVFNYSSALEKSILFYMAQRGGNLPDDYVISWRKSEAGWFEEVEMEGWFDDGSSMKTTSAMASAASLLGWGGVKFRQGYEQARQLEKLHDILRPALTFLLDAMFVDTAIQLKNKVEDLERGKWVRPSDESFVTLRKNTILSENADIFACASAALALGAQVFKETDSNYSATLLRRAEKNFQASLTAKKPKNDTESLFYHSPGDAEDEKCIASIWLFRATGNSSYISTLINSYNVVYQTELSWTNQHVLCQLLLYETTAQRKYQDGILHFLRYWMESGVRYTPQGLAWHHEEGTLRYTANAAFVALLADDLGIMPGKARNWAKSQIDYMLGRNKNAYSYLIGYGDRYPRRPHHRSSSCPDDLTPCDWSVYNSPRPNPHLLIGALVGGPDLNDYHEDARTNVTMNRVAVDYNAGFQSALAGLIEHFQVTAAPPTTPKPTTTTSKTTTLKRTTTKAITTTTKTTTTSATTTTTPTEVPTTTTVEIITTTTPEPTTQVVTTDGPTTTTQVASKAPPGGSTPPFSQDQSVNSSPAFNVSVLFTVLVISLGQCLF